MAVWRLFWSQWFKDQVARGSRAKHQLLTPVQVTLQTKRVNFFQLATGDEVSLLKCLF